MNEFVLADASLWIGDGRAYLGHVVVRDGLIETVTPGPYSGALPSQSLSGLSLSPGLLDTMVVGGFGKNIATGNVDGLLHIAREYLRLGVTAIQPCIGSVVVQQMESAAAAVRQAQQHQSDDTARFLGLYLEGPFIVPECSGGNLAELSWVPTPENVDRILEIGRDALTMINVSPGLAGDIAAIRRLSKAGLVVTMAHSNATADHTRRCVEAGTRILGHAWDNNKGLNGESGLSMPTIEHVALLDSRVEFIHLISDGHHVQPLWVELTLRCRGVEAIVLVSDSTKCAGCPDGIYHHDDDQAYEKKDGVARRVSDGGLFGGATLVPEDFRTFVRLTGIAPHEAIRTVTSNPAASLGLADEMGLLGPGRAADLVAWNQDLRVERVWKSGVAVG